MRLFQVYCRQADGLGHFVLLDDRRELPWINGHVVAVCGAPLADGDLRRPAPCGRAARCPRCMEVLSRIG
jgi:hypothetical protein